MLQLKRTQISIEGGKILFPQGKSKVLNRTEWMVLERFTRPLSTEGWDLGKALARQNGKHRYHLLDAVWEFWDHCSWFHLPLIPCTTCGKSLLSPFPNSPGYNRRINNIPLTLYGSQPPSQWNPPGWSQVHVISDIKSATLIYCRFLLPDHLDGETGL